MGMYCGFHGKGSDNVGCVQCSGRAAAERNSQLSGTAGAAGWGDRGRAGNGAALRFETSARPKGCWAGTRPPGRPANVLPDECGSDPAVARVDGNVRTAVASPIESDQGARRREKRRCKERLRRFSHGAFSNISDQGGSMSSMAAAVVALENLTLNITQEIHVKASLETTF